MDHNLDIADDLVEAGLVQRRTETVEQLNKTIDSIEEYFSDLKNRIKQAGNDPNKLKKIATDAINIGKKLVGPLRNHAKAYDLLYLLAIKDCQVQRKLRNKLKEVIGEEKKEQLPN